MPHAFKPHASHPAIAYLARLHADLGGRILENRKQAKRLADDMRHVEAVIRMFNPDFNVRAIAARRRVQGNPWFRRGTLFRYALEALRVATTPLTVRELTDALLASHGVTDATPKQHRDLEAGLRASLENRSGSLVRQVGEGIPKRWALVKNNATLAVPTE